MIPFVFDYATPSVFRSERERNLLSLAPNRRRPVRFEARIAEHPFLFRVALQTLGKLIWSRDEWLSDEDWLVSLDPIITVHPDRVMFEAFASDQSAYGALIADRALFAERGAVVCGTTNIDFTAWLAAALDELRSSRETWLLVEPEGVEVRTAGAGGRWEKKVDVPEDWVRSFLQLMGSMALPGTRLGVRPVDLLAAIRFLRTNKAKISPRALRYELSPGEPARLLLEPWEHAITLKGATHDYAEPRTIRTWGRRRLQLLEPLLPFAEKVDVYLKGRALPSFYVVHLPGMRFVLGLTGFSGHKFSSSGGFDLEVPVAPELLERAAAKLEATVTLDAARAAEALGASREATHGALARLCRLGRATYDVEARAFRHRELFDAPIDEARLYPPDPRREAARRLLAEAKVEVAGVTVLETHKLKTLKTSEGKKTLRITYRDWEVTGQVAGQTLRVVVKDTGQLIFGQCGCPFFAENLLNLGPCEHMIALVEASRERRVDLPTSTAVDLPPQEAEGSGEDDDEEVDNDLGMGEESR